MKKREKKKSEVMIEFRFRILRVPRRNISSVKNPTLKEKLVRQNSSRDKRLKKDMRIDIKRPGAK